MKEIKGFFKGGDRKISSVIAMWREGTSGGLLMVNNNRSGQLWLCLVKLKYPMDGDPMTSVGSLCQHFILFLGQIPSYKNH